MDWDRAEQVWDDAVAAARSASTRPPIEWVLIVRSIFAFSSKSYVPVIATMLLAKAVDQDLDVRHLKFHIGDASSYSMRTLGERIVIPGARAHGLSLRTTGTQPFNNSPWNKFDHIDAIDRSGNMAQLVEFRSVVHKIQTLQKSEAQAALTAFAKVALEEADKVARVRVPSGAISVDGLSYALDDFLRQEATERPRRLQAFAAACLDLSHSDVRSRKLNDPSRDVPGDVQAYSNDHILVSVEVKGRRVPMSELDAFADACSNASIRRAALFVDSLDHVPLDLRDTTSQALRQESVFMTLFEGADALMRAAIFWSGRSTDEAVRMLADSFLARLREIEIPLESLEQWTRAIAVIQHR